MASSSHETEDTFFEPARRTSKMKHNAKPEGFLLDNTLWKKRDLSRPDYYSRENRSRKKHFDLL